MRLDVGGGRNPEPGFKVLDIEQRKGVDYVCPAWDTPIDDGAVHELRARHVFEHFSPEEARKVLTEWHRIVSNDGEIEVIVPDLLYHAKQLFMTGASKFLPHETNFNHAINSIFGWRDHGEVMGHKWGYTRVTLAELFEQHGFEVRFVADRECDIHIRARKT
jgi:predicted SAM-dependent methyltransferase